jgi:hypothetical protein
VKSPLLTNNLIDALFYNCKHKIEVFAEIPLPIIIQVNQAKGKANAYVDLCKNAYKFRKNSNPQFAKAEL